jgi:FkbH-like protein
MYLRKRGILLAIISKNDESRIRSLFPEIWGQKLLVEHFAAVRFNWLPKTENMREILELMNLLPANVVFIDDNPAERQAMAAAFPGMRILGKHIYWLRRILLWSSETEVAGITEESTQKTEMVQRQFLRETQRKAMSPEDFLASAAPEVQIFEIARIDDPRFPRAFELVNKTNQFNTTGRRWRTEELVAFFESSGRIFAFSVADSFTKYGLVGAVFVKGSYIVQWVMSCRVLGYDIERAVMSALLPSLNGRGESITGVLINTSANQPCRSLYSNCGFEQRGEEWVLPPGVTINAPAHVSIASYACKA